MAQIKKLSTELQPLDKLLDTSGDAGTSGQILSSTGSGTNWISASSGTITGSGNQNYIPLWSSGTVLTNSIISSSGGDVTINGSDNDPRIYINPLGGDIGDTALIQFNSRGIVGYTGGLIELGDNGQSKDVRLRVNTADLIFQTSNTTRMTVKSTGLVGIGTASPSEKFAVTGGNIALDNGGDYILGGATTTSIIGRLKNTSGVYTLDGEGTRNIRLGSETNGEVVRIDNTNGRVGVGTDSPSKTLHVAGPGGSSGGIMIAPTSGDAEIQFQDSGVTNAYITLDDGTGDMNFRDDSATVLTVDFANERAGIKTSSPIHPLYVNGDIGQADGFRIWFRGSSSSSGTGSQSYVYSDGLNLKIKGDDNVRILGDGGGTIAHFDYSGKVGIGTLAPSELLQVAGNIRASGSYKVGATDVISSGRRFYSTDGSAASTAYSFSGFTDDGMYREVYDTTKSTVSFATEGTRRGRIGEFGIWSDANVYASSQFRMFGTWQATNGTTGGGFTFLNTADNSSAVLLSITSVASGATDSVATFSGKVVSAQTASSDGNGVLTTKSYVDGLVTGVTRYMGLWDASSGTGGSPDLTASTYKVPGYYFIVSVAGDAEPNGAGTEPDTWHVGDWVIWSDQATDAWQKIDNTSVLSGTGTANKVAMWNGDESLTNAPITISSNDSTFAGTVTAGSYFLGDDASISLATTGAGTVFLRPNGQSTSGQMKVESNGNATFAGDVTVTGGDITIGTDSIAGNINSVGDVLALNVDSNTGGGASANIQLKTAGTTQLTVTSSSATFAGNIVLDDGSGASPTITFRNGADEEWYLSENSSGKLIIQQSTTERGEWSSAGLVIKNGALSITGDGSNAATLTESSAGILTIATVDDFVVDAGGDITFDADGGDIRLKDAGSTFGQFTNSSQDFQIWASTNNKDLVFKGYDNGTGITALTLDMSDAGKATFAGDIATSSGKLNITSDGSAANGAEIYLKHANNNSTDTIGTIIFGNNADSTLSKIVSETNGANNTSNLKFRTSNAGTIGTALTLNADNSATFAGSISFTGGLSMTDSILIDYTGSDGQGIDAGVKVMNDASDWGMYIRKDSSADYGMRIDSGGANAFNIYSTAGGSTKSFGVNGGTGATSITGTSSILLTLNPTANNYGGIQFNYNGAVKGLSVYNAGSMVYGGESGVGTILQASGQHALNIDTSQNATFAGNVTLSSETPYLKIEAKNANSFVDPYLEFITWNVASGASQGKIALTNGSWNNNDMAFYTETSNALTEKMRITSTGRVGIGITTPTSTLHVNGTSNITGNATFAGTLSVGGGDSSTAQVALKGQQSLLSFVRGTSGDAQFFVSSDSSRLYFSHTNIQSTNLILTLNQDESATFANDVIIEGQLQFNSNDGATCSKVDWLTYLCPDTGTSVNSKIGYLETNFPDNSKVTFGNATNGDLQIYHDGSNSYIKENGTGVLYIQGSSNVQIEGTNGENMIICNENGSVQLHYNHDQKFQTTSTGVQVAGNIVLSGNESSIILDHTLSSNGESGILTTIGTGMFSTGDVMYLASGGGWSQAVATSSAAATSMLSVAGAGSPSGGMVLQGIIYMASHGFTIGAPLYLSTTSGDFTNTAPSGSGQYVRILGYAIDANHIYFDPDKTWVLIS